MQQNSPSLDFFSILSTNFSQKFDLFYLKNLATTGNVERFNFTNDFNLSTFLNELHKKHIRSITFRIAPLMVIELTTESLWLMDSQRTLFSNVGFTLVILIWLITFLVSNRLHSSLQKKGFNRNKINLLIKTNCIRTVLWSVRSSITIGSFKI